MNAKEKLKVLKYGNQTLRFGRPVSVKSALGKLDSNLKKQHKRKTYSGIKQISPGVYKMTK